MPIKEEREHYIEKFEQRERSDSDKIQETMTICRLSIARHDSELQELRSWQKTQNGSLLRLENKMDTVKNILLAMLGTIIGGLLITVISIRFGI